MSFLDKEYKFERQENIEELVKALDLSPEVSEILNNPASIKFTQDGDTYTLITTTDDSSSEITFTPTVPFEEKFGDTECKTTYAEFDDDEVISGQDFGNDLMITFVKQFHEDEMIEVITSTKWDGEAKKYYKA